MKLRNVIAITGFLLIIDRAFKIAALKGLTHAWSFFGLPFPRWVLHENHGAAFDLSVPRALMFTVSLILLVILMAALAQRWRTTQAPALPLIVGGAASNFYDRIRFGFVVDMIEIFPRSVWNIADMMILVGIILLFIPGRTKPKQSP